MKKLGFSGYDGKSASSFWLNSDFDVAFKNENRLDHTKLAATQRAIGNFVNIVTGQQIPVIFQSRDSSYTDGKTVVIGTKLEDKNFDPAVGLALHEGSHIAFTDFSLFKGGNSLSNTKFANRIRMKGLDPDMNMTDSEFAIIKDLLNWIEDRRIDFKVYTNAPGYRMYYEAMYNKYFNDKIIDKALVSGEKTDETLDCYLFHIINFTNPLRQLDALKELRTIWNLIDLKNIQRLTSTNDALDLACDVFTIVKSATKLKESESEISNDTQSESGDGEESGTYGTGTNTSPSSATSNADSDLEDTEDESNESDQDQLSQKELDKLEKAINTQRKFINGETQKSGTLTKRDAQIVDAIKESGTESRTVFTGLTSGAAPIETIVIKKMTPAIIDSFPDLFAPCSSDIINSKISLTESNQPSYRSPLLRRINEMDASVNEGIILGKRLGSKLQLRNSDRSLKSTRLAMGKIDRRLVAQLGYNNANVFHRIVTDRFKNYFIHISIDASGSMSGDKLRQAVLSSVAIAQAASMTTGIRVQISLRGTENIGGKTEKCVTLYAYDSAHDKMNKIKNYFKYLNYFGCTPEGIAFKSIEKDLKADAKGDELIFINYSDGEPTPVAGVENRYNGVEFTRRVINGFREMNMNIISYFIYDGYIYDDTRKNFCKMYGADAQFINPKDMREIAKTMNAKFLELSA